MASSITAFTHLQIPLKDILEATNNFDDESVIGDGGLGKVYKGRILRSGKWVKIAARRLDSKHKKGIEFWTEISALSSLKHQNIVSIIGYCDEKGEKVIINSRNAKGSLLMYLSKPTLTWTQRLKICVGVARALSYIHQEDGRNYSVIHRNVNSSTILLDNNFEPKLSGFEYSINHLLHRMDQVLNSEAIGTTGYMDPAIEKSGGVTHKSDIYSFGVVLWEILCGRKAFIPKADDPFLVPSAILHYGKNKLDDIIQPGLGTQMATSSRNIFAKVAYYCVKDERVHRPELDHVVGELEEALKLQLPYENVINNLEHSNLQARDLRIPLSDIKRATKDFSEEYCIEVNWHYSLYKVEIEHLDKEIFASKEVKISSELPKRCTTVVIKRLHDTSKKGEEVFYNELKMLSACKHPNIVTLLGFCDEGFQMILVIEHVSNGLLFNLLNGDGKVIFSWAERLKICLDVARGLNYIHCEMEDQKMIINRNIRSQNIVLDENWRAKIYNFEASVFLPPNQDDDALYWCSVVGVPGYIDPEYQSTRKLKRESDVYSFGVVLLDMLVGRVTHHQKYFKKSDKTLPYAARRCFQNETLKKMIDPNLIMKESGENKFNVNRGSLDAFLEIALRCLEETQDQRPTMKVVIQELQKALSFQEQVKRQDIDQVVDEFALGMNLTHENHGNIFGHLNVQLSDIKLATHNFSKFQVWITKFYDIYGVELELPNNDKFSSVEEKNNSELSKKRTKVVIRRLRHGEGKLGEEAFFREIEILTSCKHHNIVHLLGLCVDGLEKILVVEQADDNRYLHYYLNFIGDKPILTWVERLKICLDVAHGLNYLHCEMEDQKRIIHHALHSHNIVLDENWRAMIVNFEHSMFLPPNQDDDALYVDVMYGRTCDTDPEYMKTYRLKRESDVYSFGVVLCELLSGKVADDQIFFKGNDKGLAYVARKCLHYGKVKEMIDPVMMVESDEHNSTLNRAPNKHSVNAFLKIACKCLEEVQEQRPTMKVVIKELETALSFQMSNEQSGDEVERTLYNHRKGKVFEHLIIKLSDIMLATNDFSSSCHIRDSTFYQFYRAELEHSVEETSPSVDEKNNSELPKKRTKVVIKRIRHREDKRGEEVFFREIEMLTSCKHPNIVPLLGFCDEDFEMVLIIEDVCNVFLYDYLLNIKDKPILTWAERLKICLDVAHALKYLHYEMEDQKVIINRSISSQDIMLDENWGAKISEFNLSVFLPPNQDDDAIILDWVSDGTDYYRDPEYAETFKLKRESDVYSFGVLLLEILCGKLANDPMFREDSYKGLADVARRHIRKGTRTEMIDPIIMDGSGEKNFTLNRGPNKYSLLAYMKIACHCLKDTQDQRPTMDIVVKKLEKALFFQENDKDNNLRISLEEIKSATQNFHADNCVGIGGFGNVYRGIVSQGDRSNTIVAKCLDTKGGQGETQFRNELQILFEYKHNNIVSLVGYCDEKDAKIIVYEYAPRGSLDRYLSDARLNWMRRLKICIDVATALDFLHGGVEAQDTVIHRDIKTANILLTDDWNAKLGDFGLSLRSAINKKSDYVIDRACGTEGYVDQLYLKSGFLTIESDIYAFGVVLFEILCGRSTFMIHKREGEYLPIFIKDRFEKGKHDTVVFEEIKAQIMPEALSAFQTVAYRCLNENREERPNAKEVVEQLKKSMELQMSRGDEASTSTSCQL